MSIDDDVLAMLSTILAQPGKPVPGRLAEAHRLLAKFRAETLDREITGDGEETVRRGPFQGMQFPSGWTEGSYTPKLLGIYERELHDVISGFPDRGYASVINAGCAEGYYAVGLARLLPQATIHAYDTHDLARESCRMLARLNGVADRVKVGEVADAAAVVEHPGPVLLICDIEGGEKELLDPEVSPALLDMDILVEVHDVFVEATGETLETRFAPSHGIRRILSGACDQPELSELTGRDHLDQLLARWEGRLEKTYWLWLDSRSGSTAT